MYLYKLNESTYFTPEQVTEIASSQGLVKVKLVECPFTGTLELMEVA